ncbi:MAG: hypothetical protein IJF40_04260 [Clostridia bacterium]|nr:hypothetical protein [Clostridia bacterium]MBQ7046114.1 hypothetical protein [Oscillospiraceae bacterium]
MEYAEKINEMARVAPEAMVREAENRYHERLDAIAEKIFRNEQKRIVMLAGPSASGKTTSAKLISDKLNSMGAQAFIVSLDNFYKDQSQAVMDEEGNPDFETVHALDIFLIDKCFEEIITRGETNLPIFDFTKGARSEEQQHIKLEKDDVIIVEGIHALNPIITQSLPAENLMKLYVSVSSRIVDEDNEVIMSKRNLRFVRRLVRDYYHRASSVERTYELWRSVLKGEDKYIFPFSHLADERIDSIHAYEPCVFRNIAIPMLGEVDADSEFYDDARRMISSLECFESLDKSVIPTDSLLNEFLE